MIRAPGCSRRARRIAWRAWRSASAVTAQVLTMTASASPAPAAARRITSLSNALSRHPKVMISTPSIAPPGTAPPRIARSGIVSTGQEGSIDASLEGKGRRPGHHDVPAALFAVALFAIRAPHDVEFAAVEHDRRLPPGQPAAVGGNQGGAGAAAARPGEPGAALPDAQTQPLAVAHRRDPDIGALGKQLVVFETGAERGQINGIGIGDKKRRVRVAD